MSSPLNNKMIQHDLLVKNTMHCTLLWSSAFKLLHAYSKRRRINSFIHKKRKKVHLSMPDEVQYLHFDNENITNVQFSVCYIYIISHTLRPE